MSLENIIFTIFGGKTVRFNNKVPKVPKWPILSLFIILIMSTGAFAQGSIYGIVANSDLSTPTNGQITFVGYLDDTDEEIRIESSDGAGYDAGNWFDDFQNYLTEAPGNPYDYHFYNIANGDGFQLSKLIPNNSFQEENVLLAAIVWPATPAGLSGVTLSESSVLVTWNGTAGNTYHVYRRLAISNGSFFRIDDPTGSLSNPGVADSIFVDNTVDGVSSYDYIIIAEDASGNLSPHSSIITINSSAVDAPVLTSIDPNSDVIQGGLLVNLYGSGFDPAGVDIQFGSQIVSATVVTPYHLTMTTPPAAAGAIDVYVTNTISGFLSNTLVGGFTYDANTEPVLAVIGAQQITEGVLLQFNTSASDIDGHIPAMTSSALPGTATYVDNGDGTGTFNWTPTYIDAGVYNVTFYATDGLVPSLVDSEQVQITILEAGNQTPVLAAIGAQNGTENILLSFAVSATDPDLTIPTLTTSALPTGATFVDNGDGTGTFNWTPGFTQAGIYNITFSASDGILQDDEIVTITINDGGNQTPVLAAIGAQATTENILLSFAVSATDVDGTIPTLTTSLLPTGVTFVDNGDGTGQFDWTPDFTQSGIYDITFSASDGTLQDDEIVTITINEAGNQAPVLATIGAQATTENILLSFAVSATDVDGTIPTLTASLLPTGATFVDNGDGTGQFDWTPDFTQAGIYDITFSASDGTLQDDEIVTITINEAGNQTPVLAAIGAQTGTENILLSFAVSATDVDGTIPTLTVSLLPTGATFVDNGDGTGQFDWTPDFTQAGIYDITFSASDGILQDDEIVTITINEAGNQAPLLTAIGAQAITENILLTIPVTATDPDGTIPTLTTSLLPTGATFVDNGDGTGQFDWTPDFTQSGIYDITFSASDGTLQDDEIVTITVNEAGNQTPVLATIGAQATTENILLSFAVSATDVDGTIPTLTASLLPTGAIFIDNGDGTGQFDWTPDFTQAGIYDITFSASDGTLQDDEIVTITINEAGNQTPVLVAIGAQGGTENILLSFAVSATDADGTIPTLTTSLLPAGATFVDNGDGTGQFDWTPDFTQAGIYDITFSASDGILQDDEIVTITINEAGNQTPVLATIGAQATTENILLSFAVSATDPDGTIPTLTTSLLPTGATFVDNGDGTGQFDWTPDFTQAGIYDITFSASDGTLQTDEIVTITVNDAGNQTPVLATIGAQTGTENILLSFAVSATDADGTIPTLSTSLLPTGATFVDNGDGTGQFDWTPDFTQAGIYDITFSASDGIAQADEIVTITINDGGNQIPVLAAIGAQGTTENVLLSFAVSATDADGTFPVLTTTLLPTGATFVDNGDGTGQFDWTPDFTQSGIYNITFSASDGIAQADEIVTITVVETGNQTPILTAIGSQSITENNQLLLNITAIDPDGTISLMTTSTLPTGATFIDNLDGTAVFDWTPDFTQAGNYNVMFYASDGVEIDSELVSITVLDAGNQAPVWSTIGPQSISENVLLSFAVTATDGDGTIPTLTISALPTGATFVDNGDGTGQFDWTPDFTQFGTYNVTFTASDGVLQTDEFVTITVIEAGNQVPVLDTILDVVTSEGNLVNFVVTSSDAECIPILTTSALPTGATFVDNADGTGIFDWTPDFTQAGSYDITFYVDDDSLVQVSQLMNILVNESGSQAPIVTVVTDTTVVEGDVINIDISAVDPDGGLVVMSVNTSLNNYTFIDNGDGAALLTYSPDFYDAGVDTIVFLATDNDTPQQTGSAILVMQTMEFNQAPIFDTASAGPFAVDVNETLNIDIIAYDSTDGNPTHFLILTAIGVPSNATFTDNNDGSGSFSFSPLPGQEGVDTVTFLATDMGNPQLSVTLQVEITVVPVNNYPVLDPVGPQTILEGEVLTINLSATDADLTIPYFTADLTNLGGNGSLVDNGDGTAVFTFSPSFTQAGLVYVTFKAHDGLDYDKEVVLIQVYEAGDQTPQFYPMPDTNVTEGDTGIVVISAYDPDELPVVITVFDSTMPPNFIFEDSGNGVGLLTMMPDYVQAGIHIISFEVSDGVLADTTDIIITVNDAGNQLPIMGLVSNTSIQENSNLTFDVVAADLDGVPVMSLTSPDLPIAAISGFVDNGDGTGTFNWTPGYFDEGVYNVIFYATDDTDPGLYDSATATITVTDLNRVPWSDFPIPPPDSLFEGDTLYYTIVAWDLDSTIPVITAFLDGADTLATNMNLDSTYIDFVNGWRFSTLRFIPDYTQGSEPVATFYNVKFRVCDEFDDTLCVKTNPQTFRVYNRNQPPQILFDPVVTSPITINEGESVQFQITSIDDAGLPDSLVVRGLPATNATFTGAMQNQKTFIFNPDYTQSGLYPLIFVAYDNAGDSTAVNIDINVVEVGNQIPTITTILADTISILYNNPTVTIIDAIDLDMDSITLSAIYTGANMSFTWTGMPGSATGTFDFIPDATQVNTDFPVSFIVTDIPTGAADTLSVFYHVWPFLKGDSDSDNQYTMNDIVYLINYLFKGGQAPNPISVGDANNDGSVGINDISYLINYLYNGGPAPPQ